MIQEERLAAGLSMPEDTLEIVHA